MNTSRSKHSITNWIVGGASLACTVYYFITASPLNPSSYRFHVNLYLVGLVVGLVINFFMFVALTRNKTNRGSIQWFTLIPLFNVMWLIMLSLQFFSNEPNVAQYWQHLTPLAWVPIPFILLQFTLSYVDNTDIQRKTGVWTIPLIATYVLSYIGGNGDSLVSAKPLNMSVYFYGLYSDPSPSATVAYVLAIITLIASFVLIGKSYRNAVNDVERAQRRIFLIGLGLYFGITVLFDIIFFLTPLNNIFPLPPMTFVSTTLMAVIIGYGIIRYGIFEFSPVTLSNTILETLTEGVFGLNGDLDIQFANAGAETLTGSEFAVLRGRSIGKLLSEQHFSQLKSKLNTKQKYIEFDEITILQNQGSKLSVTLSMSRVINDNNELAGYILVITNITELKKKTIELAKEKASVERKVQERTRELSETLARLQSSVNSIDLGFVMTDERGEVFLQNKASVDLFGKVSGNKSASQPWKIDAIAKLFHGAADIAGLVSSKTTKSVMLKELQVGQSYIQLFVAPVKEKDRSIGTVMIFEDITEEKALARSRDEFFSIASHELRTPLTLLRGNAELIRDYYKDSITSEDVMHMIHDMELSSGKLIGIVNDFLDVSSLEQGKIILHNEEFDATKLLNESVEQFKKDVGDKKLDIVFTGPDSIIMNGDKERLRQTANRLLSNAAKFTEKGSITIKIMSDKDTITIRISDTGKGIDPKNQGLLFHKLQQAGNSLLTRDSEGTGLGLYICRLTIEEMGGTIELEKSEVGKGSTFVVRVPMAPAKH